VTELEGPSLQPPPLETAGRRSAGLVGALGRLAGRAAGLRHMARSLRHRNYQLFFVGQGISLMGTWMQQTALGWLVYALTSSRWYLGVVGFCGQIPSVLLTPFAGVLADHMDRRRLVVATQTLAMCQALTLAALTFGGAIHVGHIIALSVVMGLVNSFDVPIRQSFVVEMVDDKNDLSNAIALNSSLFNSARLVGPVVAGVLIEAVGPATCFLINGLSYIAVILALLAMKLRSAHPAGRRMNVLVNLKEGIKYAADFTPIKAILLQVAAMSLLGMSYGVLLPAFARDILHGSARTLGFLTASAGCGALAGALTLAARRNVRGLGRTIAISGSLFGSALIGFAFSRTLPLSMALLMLAGYGAMLTMASSNSLIQTIVDDNMRGRVMSLHALCFMGTVPFGSLLVGGMASWLGTPVALAIGGAGCIVAAVLFARKLPALGKMVHPIYVQLGLVRETADPAGPAVKQRL
jgi:MFS family permease